MVCVSDGPFGERLVRAARRMAGAPARRVDRGLRRDAGVPPPAGRASARRVARALRLAEQLGGEAVTIPGETSRRSWCATRAQRNVTELILGKPLRSWWQELLAPLADRRRDPPQRRHRRAR